jgi:hypothetical protein
VRLLTGILDRADTEKRHSRRLRLLAASCLETAGSIPDDALRKRLDACLASLIPPRDRDEARVLAALGPFVLWYLPATPAALSPTAAEMIIRTAALVGAPAAQRLLAGYAPTLAARSKRPYSPPGSTSIPSTTPRPSSPTPRWRR